MNGASIAMRMIARTIAIPIHTMTPAIVLDF